jgi:hypothetical protein
MRAELAPLPQFDMPDVTPKIGQKQYLSHELQYVEGYERRRLFQRRAKTCLKNTKIDTIYLKKVKITLFLAGRGRPGGASDPFAPIPLWTPTKTT